MAFVEQSEMIKRSPLLGWVGSFFHSPSMTFAIWEIEANAKALHEHHHEQEEVWNIVDGEIAISVDGDERIVKRGMAVVIPSNTKHSARPLGVPCRAVVTDWPLRQHLPGG